MFFLDDQLSRRRVSDIKWISSGRADDRREGTRWVHDVEMNDGSKIVILDVTLRRIEKTPAFVWASEAGLKIWSPDPENENDFLEPVVGWALTVGGSVIPVKSGGEQNEVDYDAVIISTDGSVWQNGFQQAASLDVFKSMQPPEA